MPFAATPRLVLAFGRLAAVVVLREGDATTRCSHRSLRLGHCGCVE